MRYLCLYKSAQPEGPPSPEEMARMGQFIEQEMRSGVLLATEGCLPSALGARVRLSKGNITVTDGPFAETKEVSGGLAIIQANSKEEAIESVKRFLAVAGDGETEVRALFDPGEVSDCHEASAASAAD